MFSSSISSIHSSNLTNKFQVSYRFAGNIRLYNTTVTVVIQYPVGHDFDVDYYINKRMPLAHKLWRLQGLLNAQIIKLSGDSPYQIYIILEWDSLASFQKASTSEETKEVKVDEKNFTTAVPSYIIGETVAEA